jgi:hypothetical protein
MNDNSHPAGKISVHGDGFGAPSPDSVEKRAREIALIAERDPDEFTDADWDQARRELLGTQAPNAPEETADNAEVVEEWNVVASSAARRASKTKRVLASSSSKRASRKRSTIRWSRPARKS